MNHDLAIVIPAFKHQFLNKTLKSIANQTCKSFVLYIGDDASTYNLLDIIAQYQHEIKIVYKRFNENLGNINLIAHWKRCIDMVQNEEWIWLFSDDDVMELNCVEKFKSSVLEKSNIDLFHFNIVVINQFDNVIKSCNNFPEILQVADFFSKRTKYKINSSAVEYIFKKSIYIKENGFEEYDLAWCSDDATWIKFGRRNGILTLSDSKVKWRYSGSNISSNLSDKKIVLRKLQSSIDYIKWIKEYFIKKNIVDNTSNFHKFKWVVSNALISPSLTFREKYEITLRVINTLEYKNILILSIIYLFYWSIKQNMYLVFYGLNIRSFV